jgi:hypothetical protein
MVVAMSHSGGNWQRLRRGTSDGRKFLVNYKGRMTILRLN